MYIYIYIYIYCKYIFILFVLLYYLIINLGLTFKNELKIPLKNN